MSFKVEKTHSSENNIDVNIVGQKIKIDQCSYEYPNKLLQKEEIEETSFLVF